MSVAVTGVHADVDLTATADVDGATIHRLYVANDNAFPGTIADPLKLPDDPSRANVPNPNKFFVFAFGDEHLPGCVPQQIGAVRDRGCSK
jgi:hypothetical protein